MGSPWKVETRRRIAIWRQQLSLLVNSNFLVNAANHFGIDLEALKVA